MFNGDKTYDNLTREIQPNWRTTYGNRTTGSQAQVCYWDVFWEAFVTRATVCMGVKEMGMQTSYRGACNQPPSQDLDQGHVRTLRSN